MDTTKLRLEALKIAGRMVSNPADAKVIADDLLEWITAGEAWEDKKLQQLAKDNTEKIKALYKEVQQKEERQAMYQQWFAQPTVWVEDITGLRDNRPQSIKQEQELKELFKR